MGECYIVCFVPPLECYPILILRSLVIYRSLWTFSVSFIVLKEEFFLFTCILCHFFLLPKVSHSSVYSINPLSILSYSFIDLAFCLLIHLGCLYLTHLFKCVSTSYVSTSIVVKHFKWMFKLNYLILSPSVSSKLIFIVIHINLEF